MDNLSGIVNTFAGGNLIGRDGVQVNVAISDDTILKLGVGVILTVIIARIGYIAVSNAFNK